MDYLEFLNRIISDGIEAARNDYIKEHDKPKLEGSIDGFKACRGGSPNDLKVLLETSNKRTSEEMHEYHRWRELLDESKKQELLDKYWYQRCFEAEVEWVCNCVSAIMINQGLDPIIPPTARGMMKASEIVGVKGV